MTRPITNLERMATRLGPKFLYRCLSEGQWDDGTQSVHFADGVWQAILAEYDLPAVAREEPPLPSKWRMAGNALQSAGRVLVDAVAGAPLLRSDAEEAACLAICAACDFFRPSDVRCAHPACGCHLALKGRLASMHCPLDPPKW